MICFDWQTNTFDTPTAFPTKKHHHVPIFHNVTEILLERSNVGSLKDLRVQEETKMGRYKRSDMGPGPAQTQMAVKNPKAFH